MTSHSLDDKAIPRSQGYRELLDNDATLSLLLPPTIVDSNLIPSRRTSFTSFLPEVSHLSSPLSSPLLIEGDSGYTTMFGEQQQRLESYKRQVVGLIGKEQGVYVWSLECVIVSLAPLCT